MLKKQFCSYLNSSTKSTQRSTSLLNKGHCNRDQAVRDTRESGINKPTYLMARVSKLGRMEKCTLGSGNMEKLTDTEEWFMLTVVYTRENGSLATEVEQEVGKDRMELSIREAGLMTYNKEKELRLRQQENL